MSGDITKMNFTTAENYLKRSSFSGHAPITLGGFGSTVTQTIDHNLGYIPFFDVYVEFDTAGQIWAGGEKVFTYTDQEFLSGSAGTKLSPTLTAWATTTQLVLSLYNNTSPLATGTRELYWLIYLDYSNA